VSDFFGGQNVFQFVANFYRLFEIFIKIDSPLPKTSSSIFESQHFPNLLMSIFVTKIEALTPKNHN